MAPQRCHARRTAASLTRAFAEGELVLPRSKRLSKREVIPGAAAQQTDYFTTLARKVRSARSADSLGKNCDVNQTLRF